jgi:uncharacterized protein YbjT (DUF2867 family)
VLVVGASGFVGRHACVALNAAGLSTRRATSQRRLVETDSSGDSWVYLDLNDTSTFAGALEGCRSVIYLYHGLASGHGYPAREAKAATGFREAATNASIKRLIYLGGIIPLQPNSRHLESRRLTGEIFRESPVLALELRAAMIIGNGSASFNLIRDPVARLPILALPPWLENGSCPIAIDDVAYALVRGLLVPLQKSGWFELPGPEWITHRELLSRLARLLGTRIVRQRFSMLSPALAAQLLGLIGREPHSVVSELVAGLPTDLTPRGPSFWNLVDDRPCRSILEAMLNAIADETSPQQPSVATRERLIRRVERLRDLNYDP